ncbi:MAG TPA: N-acetylglucosamine-6-phosphate deacetylase, partial [Cyclobacteriaceae bacterium]|nr:N-acetylglucosamine-6-phosphate deacetylase [Cyclobacteriaceae bacterium]
MNLRAMQDTIIIEGLHYSSNKPVQVIVEGGIISQIAETNSGNAECIIAPGLIDNQVNGYAGIDFSGDNLTHKGIEKVTRALWREGVTGYLPTLITNAHENLLRNFSILSSVQENEVVAQSIIGYHLEGPYLSGEPGFIGCHPV